MDQDEPKPSRSNKPAGKKAWWNSLLHNLMVQRGMVLLALCFAVGLQYYLVNMPVANLSQSSKFTAAKVRMGEQSVEFSNPQTDKDEFSFGYDQPSASENQRMLVDAYFDKASLSEETVQKFASLGIQAPTSTANISYVTHSTEKGTCDTGFHVQTNNGSGDRSVRFMPEQHTVSDWIRQLGVQFLGTTADVSLASSGSFGPNHVSDCSVLLSVGSWQQSTGGFIPIKINVGAGSEFRFQWQALGRRPPGWSALLAFGHLQGQSFKASRIRIAPLENSAEKAGLVARSDSKSSFIIGSFTVGTDQLQFDASGNGRVWQDGSIVSTANLLNSIGKYPLISAMFGAANLGLLNWSKRKFFPAKKSVVVRFPRRRPPDSGDRVRSRAAGR